MQDKNNNLLNNYFDLYKKANDEKIKISVWCFWIIFILCIWLYATNTQLNQIQKEYSEYRQDLKYIFSEDADSLKAIEEYEKQMYEAKIDMWINTH